MARRSSGRKSAPRPAARAPSNNVPSKPASSAPGSGLVAAIADGIGWGVGTAMAHRAVDAIVGPRVIKHETVAAPAPNMNNVMNSDACGGQSKALSDCLSNFGSDISKCQFYMNMLQKCRQSSGAALGV
ncbi:hypothetical protein V6N13_056972 [Hibiscus sabdariffa]|uniref:CHCH domain-containing protein n=2 Tax=Hibiscus sabdariffa TaxID=183260 RepID=A0ABR1ZS70_9ROSI